MESSNEPGWFARLTSYFAGLEWAWSSLVFLIRGTGTMVCFFVGAVRIICFQRLLKHAHPAPAELQQRARTLGTQIGLKSVPRVDLISGAISPLLWACFSRARIILPAQLLQELNDAEVEALLLHELAHYRRGDHWVRLIELLTTGLYWWYPVVWWVRREIRVIEETCCDAWVIQTEPDKRRAYAEVLVKATGFVSQAQCISAATGMGTQRILEQRLTSIMCDSLKLQISWRGKFLLATVALLLLSLAPLPGTSQAETQVAEKPDQLPNVEEILGGYWNNLQRLLPLEMTYRIMAQENMNCITRDRLNLQVLRNIQKADRNEIKIFTKNLKNFPDVPTVPGRSTIWDALDIHPHQQIAPETLALRFPEETVYENKIDGGTYVTGTEQPLPEDPEPPEMVHLFTKAPSLQVAEWLDGNKRNLKDFRGKVVVLLFLEDVLNYDFSEMSPEMEQYVGEIKKMLLRLHQKYADKEIIFLEIYPPGTSKVKIREFHQNRGFKTLAAIDQRQAEGGATNQKYHGVHVAPTCFLLSRKGRVVFSPEIYDSIMAEDYFQHTARKLSISLDDAEKLPEDEAIRQSLRIMEFIIGEQIDIVLAIQ